MYHWNALSKTHALVITLLTIGGILIEMTPSKVCKQYFVLYPVWLGLKEFPEIFAGRHGKNCIGRTSVTCTIMDFITSDRRLFQLTVKKICRI
jgi:hypothetical protein